MHRRQFLKGAAVLSGLATGCAPVRRTAAPGPALPVHRVRPADPSWPSEATWDRLRQQVHGRLLAVESPLAACRTAPAGAACTEVVTQLHNPYYLSEQPALTQSAGWLDAWTSAPSVYAVAVATTADVVAAVNFARAHHLRLVVKGGGHSYQGTSCAPDSLLLWMRPMHGIMLHEGFVPHGAAGHHAPQPAVTVDAGALWMQVYEAVTTQAGRYVQGGGCTTVGVAGLILSGGFGSFSKRYGLAAAGLLEAEVVTADGVVRIANARTHPELFWALKGGGGGSFGVVTRLTLRTHELPAAFGGVFGAIKATSDTAFRTLTAQTLRFYHERLSNPQWGEQLRFGPDNTLRLGMVCCGLDQQQAAAVWRPFLDWVTSAPQDFAFEQPVQIVTLPARQMWNARFLTQHAPGLVVADDRPGAPAGQFWWRGDQDQVGHFWHGYRSAWLPAALLAPERQRALADALFAGSRHWPIALHCNKGLAGAPADVLAAAKDTAVHPVVVDAFALAIIGGGGPPAFADLPGPAPEVTAVRRRAGAIHRAMEALLQVVPQPGSYVAESDFFEPAWQQAFWGTQYPRLAAVKRQYDPRGLFVVHHGVGSEDWSADGFTRVAGR
jgi:FAD/FMN-containing dehydrogenase